MSPPQKTGWVCSQFPQLKAAFQMLLDRSCLSPFSCTDEGEPLSLSPHYYFLPPLYGTPSHLVMLGKRAMQGREKLSAPPVDELHPRSVRRDLRFLFIRSRWRSL